MAGKTKEFTSDNFNADVLESKTLVLVDFWASWCGPCKMIAPTVEKIAEEYEGKIIVGKVNVDESTDIAKQYGIMSIPTLVLFKDGQRVNQVLGLVTKNAIVNMIDEIL
jgi:thioredoxin 1